MQIIGIKREIERLTAEPLEEAPSLDEKTLTLKIKRIVLPKKVRFQALEHFPVLLYKAVSIKHQITLLNEIAYINQIGGNVVLGRILRLRLKGCLAATHYTVKKGFSKNYSEQSFLILLSCGSVHHPDIKKGVGWAAKTVAKFHPDLITKYRNEIDTNPEIKKWFITKINIGLGRAFKYASRYPG